MILDRPTGSYAVVLPKEPSDSTSVVYTISSTDPPRSQLNFDQIPTGIAMRQRDPRTIPSVLRRGNYGSLVFTVKDNQPGRGETGNQMFYTGQVFGFSDVSIQDVEIVPTALQTEHDQYYVDANNIGLTDDDLGSIELDAVATQKLVLLELEGLQKREDDLKVDIVSQQRIINEADLVVEGLDVILAKDPGSQSVIEYKIKVLERKAAAEITLNEDIIEINLLPAQVDIKHTELRALAPLID